ncbi:MAG: metallophosphoesterase [Clostridia bacterium]|nr:metallophosphoesterase [Clostridia bacterium]
MKNKAGKKKKRKWYISALLFLLPAVIVMGAVYSYLDIHQYDLGVTEYTVSSKKTETNVKIAVVADLHNHEYGEENIELINKIKEKNPDLIAVVGDVVMKDDDNISVLDSILRSLTEIAPTYFCLGNHELALIDRGIDIESVVSATGAVILDDELTDVCVNGLDIVIGGLSYNSNNCTYSFKFLLEFAERDEYKLLLCHYPEFQWRFMKYDIDLVLCGHLHGGLIRLPGAGALFAPTQGFFPEFTEGVHKSDTATMIVSRGLGSSSFIPRVNNPTELVFVDVVPG